MANSLNKDLTNKVVKVKDQKESFVCESGFGCLPTTNGQKIFGYWFDSKEKDMISGYCVEEAVE